MTTRYKRDDIIMKTISPTRRQVLALGSAASLAPIGLAMAQSSYPNKPINMIY